MLYFCSVKNLLDCLPDTRLRKWFFLKIYSITKEADKCLLASNTTGVK